MAIKDKLEHLLETKQAIKQAIIDKGQEIADTDTFRSYAEKIKAIEAGSAGLDYNIEQVLNEETGAFELRITDNPNAVKDMLQAIVDATNSCDWLFHNYAGTEFIDISRLDTSKVTTMAHMFYNCDKLQTLDLSSFNTSNVTYMNDMFRSCTSLTELDISSFNTSKVTNMTYMFYYCQKLQTLDLSSFNTSNVTNMAQMFNECTSLTELDLSSFNTSNVTDMSNMFNGCSALTELDLSSFNTSKVRTTYIMFNNCKELQNIIGVIDMRSVRVNNYMITGCNKLTNITLKNIKINLQLGSGTTWGHLLSLDSLTNAINELWVNTGSATTKLTIGTANLAKLDNVYVKLVTITDEMRAEDEYIDNKLPFVVCESTDEGAMLILDYAQNLKNWVVS